MTSNDRRRLGRRRAVMLLLTGTLSTVPLMVGTAQPTAGHVAELPSGDIIAGAIGQALDARLRALEQQGLAAVVLAVKRGDVVLHRAYGLADREANRPMTRDTLVNLGSITKQFTAAAVMKLHEHGKLTVDDAIHKYLRDVPEDKRAITIHHLLTHRGGLPAYAADDWERLTRAQFLKNTFAAPLRFPPGTREEYSNVGYSLLAILVEEIAKTPYEEFVRDELFRPAGMRDTGYELPDWSRKTAAVAYGSQGRPAPFGILSARGGDRAYWAVMGNGEMLTTTADVHRWFRALQGTTVLSEASKRLMFPAQAERDARQYRGYGGLMIERPAGHEVALMNGGNGFYSNEFRRYPAADSMLYVAVTNRVVSAVALSGELERILNPYDLPDSAWPAPPPAASPQQETRGVPAGSPRLKRANELIALINTGDPDEMRQYVREQFAPELLKSRDAADIVEQLLRIGAKLGRVQLGGLVVELPDVAATLQSTNDPAQTVRITFAVASQPPHLIYRFDLDPA
jgi:CubicO group peptidase (beta-lactamase class C family)